MAEHEKLEELATKWAVMEERVGRLATDLEEAKNALFDNGTGVKSRMTVQEERTKALTESSLQLADTVREHLREERANRFKVYVFMSSILACVVTLVVKSFLGGP